MKRALLICAPNDHACAKYETSLIRQGYAVIYVQSIAKARSIFNDDFARVSFGGNECTNEEARDGVFFAPPIRTRVTRMAAE